jgi:uncharacterized protein YukE
VGGNSGGQQQSEQKTSLGFPMRPEGDGEAIKAGRHYWYELAGDISGAFADIDRAISGMQWSGDARRAFRAVWSQFSGHGTEASQYAQEMGGNLFKLGNHIEDAQHEWDLAMAAMAASAAIGLGLTFVTFGISDAVAEGAAATAVGTMEAVCGTLDAAMEVLVAAARIGAQLAVKLTWQFSITTLSQEGANLIEGKGVDSVDLLRTVGVSMLVAGDTEILSPVTALRRVGSALKQDIPKNVLGTTRVESESEFTQVPLAHGFPDIIDNYAGVGSQFTLPNGAVLYQVQGSLAGVSGRFEWIVDRGAVTHRMFVKGGLINGVPIQP